MTNPHASAILHEKNIFNIQGITKFSGGANGKNTERKVVNHNKEPKALQPFILM